LARRAHCEAPRGSVKIQLAMPKRAIGLYCSTCSRETCRGGPFEAHSQRLREVQLFLDRRARIATARRKAVAG
jgi:hypothetical protein